MPFYNLYLGYADDPKFQWEGGRRIGNIPKVIVNFGAITPTDFTKAVKLLESPAYEGRVLDWGASGARLPKARVSEFLNEFYPAGAERDKILLKLDKIEDDRLCVLFACEM